MLVRKIHGQFGPVRSVSQWSVLRLDPTCKLADIYAGALAADHGVTFPDLLNTEADEGQLQHTKLCLLSSKTNPRC